MALYRWSTKISWVWKWFNPENAGTTWQVLTKTATGYNYQDAPSGLPEWWTAGKVVRKTANWTEWDDVADVTTRSEYSQITPTAGKIYFLKQS